ncbi:histidine kinase dimerization/phosphoacceptor domain -containing protein [Massilia sp. HP4]|uniref:histidine kinase dimerization/phosphoacceptor domain -containing protein n=1 Tax=Massilia sp. HP4 TaxID=2562316 RepID=UPI0010BFFED1|nr:histidine kinase dimerization/phosphoacceptor domain -containing protein [Massilia sp. HP4]
MGISLSFPSRRAPTIRQWLALLLAAFIVPTTLAVVALFLHSYGRERAGLERASQDVSRALMQAIDRELSSAQAALQALATSPSLDAHDLRAFHAQAIEVLHARPGNVLVATDAGLRQVINTGRPLDAALPRHGNAGEIRNVFDTERPMVSDLYLGPTVNRLLSSVDVPVVRGGQVRYVLSMQYFGERLGAILERQQAPPGATVTIYDGRARVVWSSRATRTEVGRRASSALAAGFALGPEGTVDEPGPDGAGLVTVFSHSSLSEWTVAIALQRSALNANLWRSLEWIIVGGCALLLLGAALVALIGTRIEAAVRGLVRPAIALGHGEQVVLPPLPLDEALDVGHALVQTAALLRERTIQRDEAERAERTLREAKRAVERSEAFLRGIFEETPDGILLVGPDCRVVRANGQAERMFGYPAGTLEGQALDALIVEAGDQPGSVCERMRAVPLRSGMAGTTHLRGLRRDGDAFAADAMANPLPERALLIVTVRDVSAGWEQEEALRHALEDKNTLLKELYHRVKNNLQLVISLFNLQARTLRDGRAQHALQEAANRVRAMALVHERLYQSRTLGAIRLDDYVGELCVQLASAGSAHQRGIELALDVAPVHVGLDLAVPLGLLLNELVSNSLKHAFPDGRRGTIHVTVAREPDDGVDADDQMLRLTVRDDGIGLPPGSDGTSPQTLGLRLVSALSEQLHAKLVLENRGGACIRLVFHPGLNGKRGASHAADALSHQTNMAARQTAP